MRNLSAFPVWDENNNKVVDGTLIASSSLCEKIKTKKCIKHYSSIKNNKGFHICPAGLTTYSTGEGNCFSSVKVNGHYDVTKTKRTSDFLPAIPPNIFLSSINKSSSLLNVKSNSSEMDSDIIDFSIHEVRRFNGVIKRLSEELLLIKEPDINYIKKKVKSIFASSSLISVRLNAFDLEENPDVITSQSMSNSGIYKKFEKASHCLDSYAKDNDVKILPFKGRSHLTIDMYQIFDLIPFVIMENAIKYSPKGQVVQIEFDEISTKSLQVAVTSTGPTSSKLEIAEIFEKKSRGYNASLMDGTGGGYGLYFAKKICDMHGVEIEAQSKPCDFQLNGIDYSEFTIKLNISN
jgi:hypothetical protein